MRKLLTALVATAALGVAAVADGRAQDLRDTVGRALQGLQGGQDQRRGMEGYTDGRRENGYRDTDRPRENGYRDIDRRRDDRGYRAGERRYDERDMERRGMRDGDNGRRSTWDAERRLDEQQRRLDDERRRAETEGRGLNRER